jgi:hypothetical protein
MQIQLSALPPSSLITTLCQHCLIVAAAERPAVVRLELPYSVIRLIRRLDHLDLEDSSSSEDESSSSDTSSSSDNSSTYYSYDISDYFSDPLNSESSDSSDD